MIIIIATMIIVVKLTQIRWSNLRLNGVWNQLTSSFASGRSMRFRSHKRPMKSRGLSCQQRNAQHHSNKTAQNIIFDCSLGSFVCWVVRFLSKSVSVPSFTKPSTQEDFYPVIALSTQFLYVIYQFINILILIYIYIYIRVSI